MAGSEKILIGAFVTLFLMSSSFSLNITGLSRHCKYKPGAFIFHCSNSRPGRYITPGDNSSYIEITCCFTSDAYWESNETVDLTVNKVYNYTYLTQERNGSVFEHFEDYPATQFISKIEAPSKVRGFEEFKVRIWFDLPKYSPVYVAGENLEGRVDVILKLGTINPKNAIFPQIYIPPDWEPAGTIPISWVIYPVITGSCSLAGYAIYKKITLKKKRKKKKSKKSTKRKTRRKK